MGALATLGTGSGAYEGLKELLARRMMEAKFAEDQRQALARESHDARALDESAGLRRLTQRQLEQERLRDETFRRDQLGQNEAFRRDQLAQTKEVSLQQLAQAKQLQEMLETGRNERAADQRATQLSLGQLANAGRAETQSLRNDLLRTKTQQAQDKLDATRTERERSEKSRTDMASNTLALLDRMEKHPGLNKAYGAYEMRGFTQDARDFDAIRNQAVAALTVPNLGSLKGPMSDKDIIFVKELATRLQNRNISEAEALKAIAEARRLLQGSGAGPAPTGGGGSSFRVIGVR